VNKNTNNNNDILCVYIIIVIIIMVNIITETLYSHDNCDVYYIGTTIDRKILLLFESSIRKTNCIQLVVTRSGLGKNFGGGKL